MQIQAFIGQEDYNKTYLAFMSWILVVQEVVTVSVCV